MDIPTTKPGRRRISGIPVAPPRIPTPMPDPRVSSRQQQQQQQQQQHHQQQQQMLQQPQTTVPATLVQAKQFLEESVEAWINPRIYAKVDHEAVRAPADYGCPRRSKASVDSQQPTGRHRRPVAASAAAATTAPASASVTAASATSEDAMQQRHAARHAARRHGGSSVYTCSSQASAAAAFFARAAQKLTTAQRTPLPASGPPESFYEAVRRASPSLPQALVRRLSGKEVPAVGKVKVLLRVRGPPVDATDPGGGGGCGEDGTSTLGVDRRKKQVALHNPTTASGNGASSPQQTPEDRRVGVAAPKMFAFDGIFCDDDQQSELCACALSDVLHAVISGSDGCVFCFGQASLGKTHTMVGCPDEPGQLGVIPSAITWLFRAISEQKQRTGARFSVRVSAVQVNDRLSDLLADHANAEVEQAPGVLLSDDPGHSELRVPTAERAAFYLDEALANRAPGSLLLYRLHLYQYRVASRGQVVGGRSRLHLIDLGGFDRIKANGCVPLSSLGNVLMAILNRQKHIPMREQRVTHVLRDCLGSLTCHTAMVVHVSAHARYYSDTLATLQLASRIHRLRHRSLKYGNPRSGIPWDVTARLQDKGHSTGSSELEPSSSEQSADTVIYVGSSSAADDSATDGEHPPLYRLHGGGSPSAPVTQLRSQTMDRPKLSDSTTRKSPQHRQSSRPMAAETMRSSHQHHHQLWNGVYQQMTPDVNNKASPQHRSGSGVVAGGKFITPLPESVKGSPQHRKHYVKVMPKAQDERWIDGPLIISRSKVAEVQLLNGKRETWIDGPLQAPNGYGYGFMDTHKQSMIKKWVENQTIQAQRHIFQTGERPPTTGAPRDDQATDCSSIDDDVATLTGTTSTNGDEGSDNQRVIDTENVYNEAVISIVNRNNNQLQEPQTDNNADDSKTVSDSDLSNLRMDAREVEGMEERKSEDVCYMPLLYSESLNKEFSLDGKLQTKDDLADVQGNSGVEIIEVEEPTEPVETQDLCLQVTEDDIAYCMGRTFSQTSMDGEDSTEDHPLRILSEENLTVVSTFTDSLSVTTDLELQRFDPRPQFEFQLHPPPLEPSMTDQMSSSVLPSRSPSRCLSLTDVLSSCEDNAPSGGGGSIFSEPLCSVHQRSRRGSPLTSKRLLHRTLLLKRSSNIAALRLPDGASNPNIREEEPQRVPGNGASSSDTEEEVVVVVPKDPVKGELCVTTTTAGTTGSSGYGSLQTDGTSSGSTRLSDLELRPVAGVVAEVLQYCREDVDRLERGWSEARSSKVRQLREQQLQLREELAAAKARLMLPPSRWRYELHVESSMDQRDPGFVEALTRETEILRKRVEACKSRVMLVTCFDCQPRYDDSSPTGTSASP